MPNVYYSKTQNLQFWHGTPRKIIQDGIATIEHGLKVQFAPYGVDGWGHLVTDDPQVIAACDARIKAARDKGLQADIMTPEEYREATTPIENKLQSKEDRIRELERQIESNNALIARLQGQGKLPSHSASK